MAKQLKDIEIPFGAYDSELGGFEYTIPEGYKAEIKDGKVVVRKTESEDERIRKSLIGHLKECRNNTRSEVMLGEYAKWIAWLEKQGEHNPAETEKGTKGNEREIPNSAWGVEDEENLNWFEKFFRAESVIAEGKDIPQDKYLWFKNLKDRVLPQPKQEWSDYDECMLTNLIDDPHCSIDSEYVHWLKSLKDKYTWKPSDEQMEGIECTIKTLKYQLNCGDNRLDSLYNDLKKLRDK